MEQMENGSDGMKKCRVGDEEEKGHGGGSRNEEQYKDKYKRSDKSKKKGLFNQREEAKVTQ